MKIRQHIFVRCLLLYAIFPCTFGVHGQDLDAINEFIAKENTLKIRELAKQEAVLFEKTSDLQHELIYHFLLAFSEPITASNDQRITNLLWVIEHARRDDKRLLAYSNYHLASLLIYLNSNRTAAPFAEKAIELAKQCNELELTYLSYSLLVSNYYNLKDYTKAIIFYEKALTKCRNKNTLFKASTYNNISLCKMNQNDLNASNAYILKSLEILKVVPKSEDTENFQAIVEGNLGSNYFKQNKLVPAIRLLEKELDLKKNRLFHSQNYSTSMN